MAGCLIRQRLSAGSKRQIPKIKNMLSKNRRRHWRITFIFGIGRQHVLSDGDRLLSYLIKTLTKLGLAFLGENCLGLSALWRQYDH